MKNAQCHNKLLEDTWILIFQLRQTRVSSIKDSWVTLESTYVESKETYEVVKH